MNHASQAHRFNIFRGNHDNHSVFQDFHDVKIHFTATDLPALDGFNSTYPMCWIDSKVTWTELLRSLRSFNRIFRHFLPQIFLKETPYIVAAFADFNNIAYVKQTYLSISIDMKQQKKGATVLQSCQPP
jgi:hypothetical protein